MTMPNFIGRVAALLCVVAIAGCSTNRSIANITTPKASLEVAVGTINDNFDTLGIGGVTLNVVTSFRNALGNSAYQTPGNFALAGPGGGIVAANGGSPCPIPPSASPFTTDELFSYGLAPGCVIDAAGNAVWG